MLSNPRSGAWLRRSRCTAPTSDSYVTAFDEGTGYRLTFHATISEPNYAKLFLAAGGAINTAAAAGPVDFSVTGSTASVKASLHSNECRTVSVDLPPQIVKATPNGIKMDSMTKLNVSSQRVGAAINGTLVDTHAGAGSVYIANLLRASAEGGHTQLPCVYGVLASHACTLGISNLRIFDAESNEVDVEFEEDAKKLAILANAEKLVDAWAHNAWNLREQIVYKLSPTLTKSVAKVPVGVNDKGYELVHNVVDQEYPFSIQSLDSLFQHAIGMELEYNSEDTTQMLAATSKPGMKAAVWAQTVAAACSTAATYLVAYRADGRTVMRANGSSFESTESWLRTPMRTPCESNDCDGSGLLVLSMIQAATDTSDEELAEYPYVRAIKHAVFPYYTSGIAVVAATSAEASGGGGGGGGDSVAGHALALMVPTLSFLEGLDTAATKHTVAGKRISDSPDALRKARFEAVFSEKVLATLPEEESAKLRNGDVSLLKLQPYAIEGTTPASPVLFIRDADERTSQEINTERDSKAFALAAPNVGRSMKVLHVGGKHKADPHRFYHDFVELSVHPSHPLYSNERVRELGAGATQFLFVSPRSVNLDTAGSTPRQLATQNYAVVPLHTVDSAMGKTLDVAAVASKEDVIPPRAGPMLLTLSQSTDLRKSIAALKDLDSKLAKKEIPGWTVAYTFAYSTLVNNPLSVQHFCDRVSAVAVAGQVDFRVVEKLAVHPGEGAEQAGNFVVANVVMRV